MTRAAGLLMCLLAASLCGGATGQTEARAIPDVDVLDQNGTGLHFYRDLVKDQVVAIQFIFTSCRTVCPPLAATFKSLQDQLSGSPHIRLISVTVDPEHDRPDVLRRFGAAWNVRPGWTLVTGEPAALDQLRRAFGDNASDKTAHSPLVWIGARGRWTRVFGVGNSGAIKKLLEAAAAESGAP